MASSDAEAAYDSLYDFSKKESSILRRAVVDYLDRVPKSLNKATESLPKKTYKSMLASILEKGFNFSKRNPFLVGSGAVVGIDSAIRCVCYGKWSPFDIEDRDENDKSLGHCNFSSCSLNIGSEKISIKTPRGAAWMTLLGSLVHKVCSR